MLGADLDVHDVFLLNKHIFLPLFIVRMKFIPLNKILNNIINIDTYDDNDCYIKNFNDL